MARCLGVFASVVPTYRMAVPAIPVDAMFTFAVVPSAKLDQCFGGRRAALIVTSVKALTCNMVLARADIVLFQSWGLGVAHDDWQMLRNLLSCAEREIEGETMMKPVRFLRNV